MHMPYVLNATAQAIVAAAADFNSGGLVPPPHTQIEGLYDAVMLDRYERAAVMARGPAIVQVLNDWAIEQRTAWMMNNFQTDERYANAWNIAQRAMNVRASYSRRCRGKYSYRGATSQRKNERPYHCQSCRHRPKLLVRAGRYHRPGRRCLSRDSRTTP
jgi:hypothetical protein